MKKVPLEACEKKTGGHREFQGTRVSLALAIQLCRRCGFEDSMQPVLAYDLGQDVSISAGHPATSDYSDNDEFIEDEQARITAEGS